MNSLTLSSVGNAMPENEDLSTRLLESIGKVTVEMSAMEFSIRYILCCLMANDLPFGMSLTIDMYQRKLLELLKRTIVYKVSDPILLDRFKKLATDITASDTQRNDLVHSVYGYSATTNQSMRRQMFQTNKLRLGVGLFEEPIDENALEKFNKLAVDIRAQINALFDLFIEICDNLNLSHANIFKHSNENYKKA